jgi:Short C-terminal domain
MALGVNGMTTGRVVTKTVLLTVGTLGFVVCLTLMYHSMRAVMDVGGSCASGGPYAISRPCPDGVAWVMPVAIFGGIISVGIGLLGVFPQGGPRPYAFAWSALFLALGWNFLEYGFDPPAGGTSPGWLVCGFVFVLMGGVPLALLLWRSAARWAFWGPAADDPDTYLRPYRPPPRPGSPRAAMPTPTPTPRAAGGLVVPATPVAVAEPVPSAPDQVPDAPAGDVVDRLERLADLHARGLLDDEEYEKVKDRIVNEGAES